MLWKYKDICFPSCCILKMIAWFYLLRRDLCKLPSYIYNLLTFNTNSYCTRSASQIQLKVLRVYSEFSKFVFSFYAPWVLNELQNVLSLDILPPLSIFKCLLQCFKGDLQLFFLIWLHMCICSIVVFLCETLCAAVLTLWKKR